jgi:predicted enzyme related to lactoylglutathione lyase
MSNTFLAVSIDCADAATLADFWAAALGRTVNDGASTASAGIAADVTTTSGPLLLFHQVPEPKTVKNRLHFDLRASSYAEELDRLIGLGATKVNEVVKGDNRWTTLADPEGNEFDLLADSSGSH